MATPRRVSAVPARPAQAVLDEASAAWQAGEYERVLGLLDEARFERREDRVAAAHAQARALLAAERADEAVAVLRRSAKEARGTEEAASNAMLLGAALARTGKRSQGEALLEEAYAAARRGGPLAAEVAYYRALIRWSTNRLAEAEEIVDGALPSSQGRSKARLLQLLGWMDVRRENFGAAAHQFTAAVEELNRSRSADRKLRAKLLVALGIIASETLDLRLGRMVRREYDACPWGDETRLERFQVLQHLSWLSLLEGDVTRAWDERQLGLTLTADSAQHASALNDAAFVAGIVGDRFSERRYLDLAGTLLIRGDQVGLDVDHRMAMLQFVCAVPAANAETARKVMTLYERTAARRTEMLAFEGDRRLEANELWARGKLALAEGNAREGIAQLERSLQEWTRLGYRLRMALVGNTLRAVTGERRYAQTALDALRSAPNAWLREALERRAGDTDPLAQLTPAERRVLAELCKGRKAREIAATFGRSFNTINNHTRAVFSAFGVRSRAALVAECARLGILADGDALR